MTERRDLGRQLALSMAFVVLAMLCLTFVVFYAVYAILFLNGVRLVNEDSLLVPTGWDALTMVALCITGLALSSTAAVRLARRIVSPLDAVARAARNIASGDLTARARTDTAAIGETAMLIDDFNAMAVRLERMAKDVITWNAQIAHELRTPLTILTGRMQGISDGVFVADDAMIRSLLGQVEGLRRIVEDLRIVSLVDSDRLGLELIDVNLADEIEDVAGLLLPSLEKAGFGLDLVLDRGPARVDMARVRQAILALVDNAQRYASPCTLRIALTLSDSMIDLRVVDTGPGMSEEFAQDAFRIFTRSREKAGVQGSGLGLAVVHAIARAHGGDATYSSSEGHSTFRIVIPRRLVRDHRHWDDASDGA
tara:strand:+ start:9111 stop:10211 length:1101 start_codon:yes stop_codon:yes gene_type:complete